MENGGVASCLIDWTDFSQTYTNISLGGGKMLMTKYTLMTLTPFSRSQEGFGGGRRCCVSYITGASNLYWLTVGQGLLSL